MRDNPMSLAWSFGMNARALMTLDTIVAIIIAIFEFGIIVYDWKQKDRIKNKEEVWTREIQSISARARF